MRARRYSRLYIVALLTTCMGFVVSCSKSPFLDKKPSTNLVVPTSLSDFQALLDNTAVIGLTPVLGEMSADNFYLIYNFWQGLDVREHNAYIWAPDIYGGQGKVDDWDVPYQQVFYANVILEGLPNIKVDSTNVTQWNTIKGSALFTRAFAFYNLAQLFAPIYDSVSSRNLPAMGIPIRLTADVNAPTTRSTVQQTYDQILADLQQAVALLPAAVPYANPNRPSRPAAQALLARVYLSMRNYGSAGAYANSCLQSYPTLMDYNRLDTGTLFPIHLPNIESLYQSTFFINSQVLIGGIYPQCVIDSGLYQSYAVNDRRRGVFYRITSAGTPSLKGSYNGTLYPFSGLATDEMYLVRAECAARMGQITAAMNDLDTLWSHRCDSGTFVPFTVPPLQKALDTILLERRKELAFRGLRWTDLQRLNMDESRHVTLSRNLNGTIYTLKPNTVFYTLPIPPDVLGFSKIPDNPRQ